MDQDQVKYRLFVFLIAAFAVEAIFFSAGNFRLNQAWQKEEDRIAKMQSALSEVPVEAKAVSVYEIDSGREIYGKNQNEPLPLASLAKTMTVLVALADHEPGSLITISQNALNQEGDYGLWVSEKWKIENLARFTLIGSANDGAYALTEGDTGILEKMNEKAKKIGMENTLFLNSTGLDADSEKAGAYASARDANVMAMYALKARPEIFSVTSWPEISLKSESGFQHNIKNTNIIMGDIPNLLFSKTGFTGLAGGNLTVIFKNKDGHEIAITVLGSTFAGRFSDIEKLVNALYNQGYESGN